jgi:putative endonuclease
MIARLMFAMVNFAARKGLAEESSGDSGKQRARRTGVRGETYAYWYLRRRGYTVIARNFTSPAVKGEIDLVGYDGPTLAFIEVKTRSDSHPNEPRPEDAVNAEKRRNLARMARHFLRVRRLASAPYRFDILAIESHAGSRPEIRLHKSAFRLDSL